MIIGITGSSGSGKSTICDILKNKYHAKIIDADKIAKQLSKRGTNYVLDIVKAFGKDILDDDGELKRKKLAGIIYTDPKKRQLLNSCTFKYIKAEIKKQVKEVPKDTTVIIDAPLLFESGLEKLCDKVIGVISKRELQLDRIVARDNVDYDEAEKRLSAQASNEFYKEKCDVIIENNNDVEVLQEKIDKTLEK